MYQFRKEDIALQAALLLAVYERTPVMVMARDSMELFSIGPTSNAAVQGAGRHIATVYRHGQVHYMGRA